MYTAFNLLDKGVKAQDITIVAQYLPGDESINYTSPYAGGNFLCITGNDPETLHFDKFTYLNLGRIQRALGGASCGLDRCTSYEHWEHKPPQEKIDSLKSYLDQYEEIPEEKLPANCAYGIKFLSWSFNCPKFLSNFHDYLVFTRGVKIVRKQLSHITQGFVSAETKVVLNCTGLGSHKLGGVNDTKCYPTRGQVVVIKAPHIKENVMFWGSDFATYIIKRPYSNDQLILGGFMEKDNWTADTFGEQTKDILQRTTTLFPKILKENPAGADLKDLEILRVVSGLRPSRHGGVRIEKELIDEGKIVVHNYGASGYGYQAGFGMGEKAARLAIAKETKI